MSNMKLATIISYVTLMLGNVISLFYTPYMLVTLGQAEYGLFSLVNTIISYIYLLDMGFNNAIIRYNSKYIANNDENGLIKVNSMFICLYSLIGIIAFALGIFIFMNLDNIFARGLTSNEIELTKTMFLIALTNLAISFPLGVFNGIIMAHEKFVFIKVINLIRTILNPIIMVLILALGYRAVGMVFVSSCFNILIGLINVIYCLKVIKIKFKISFKIFDINLLKEIGKFSFFILLTSIASKIYWSTDQFVLGVAVSSASISIYSIGVQFNSYFTALSNVLGSMFLPKLTKIVAHNNNKEELMKIITKVSRLQFYIGAFVLSGFILIGKNFIKIWAGEGYEASYYIALLVMIPQIISIVQMLFATMLEAMNKHKIKSYIYMFVAILNLILTIIFVQFWGAIGCAMATAIGMIINAILNNLYYSYWLNLDMKTYWQALFKPFLGISLSFVIGIIIIKFIEVNTYFDIMIFALIFSCIYFVMTKKISFNEYENEMIKRTFNKCLKIKSRTIR